MSRILVIIKEPDTRDTVCNMLLADGGLNIESCSSVSEADSRISLSKPHLVVTTEPAIFNHSASENASASTGGWDRIPVLYLGSGESETAGISPAPLSWNILQHPFSSRELLARIKMQLRITALENENEELRRVKEDLKRFKFMSDHATDAFILMRADGSFAYLNEVTLRRWGYTKEESAAIRVPDVDPIYDQEKFRELFARAQREPVPAFETLHKKKDGTVYPVEVSLDGITLDGERLMLAIARDITNRKQAEQELRLIEARFKAFFNQSSLPMSITTLTAEWVTFNDAYPRIFGYTREELSKMSFRDISHPDEAPTDKKNIAKIIAGEERSITREKKYVHKDGSVLYAILHITTIRDEQDKPVYLVAIIQDITQRKKAEEELKASEERYRLVVETLEEGIVIQNTEGVLVAANRNAEKHLGLTVDQIRGRTSLDERWRSIYEDHTPMPGHEHPPMRALAQKKNLTNQVMGIHKPDGDLVWLSVNSHPIIGKDGILQGVISSFFDITERKWTESLVTLQKEVLEFVAQGKPLGYTLERLVSAIELQASHGIIASILLVDEDGKRLRHGAASSLPLEYREAIDGVEIGENVGSCGTAAFKKQVVIAEDIETDPLWKDYKEIALRHNLKACWSAPLFSSEGNVLGTLALYYPAPRKPGREDMQMMELVSRTAAMAIDRTRIREALHTAEENWRSLVNNIQNLAWMADPDGWIFWYNQRWYEYTGTTPQQMEGWGWQSVHDPAVLPEVLEKWKASIATGQPFEMVFPLKGADNIFRPFLTRVVPVRDRDDKIIRWLGTNTDITPQIKIEEELKRAQHETKMLMKKKDEFMSIASHELKTPITSMKGYLQVLERLTADVENITLRNFTSKANKQVDKLTRLVDDLLDVTRIHSGKMQLNIAPFNLHEIIQDAIEQSEAYSSTHAIEVIGDANVPCVGDKVRLEQVINNFISNAIKYSPGKDKVILEIAAESDEVKVAVTDFGIGIPSEKQEYIFNRFFRVEDSIHKFSGLGLGLYISSEIVARHGGKVGVTSEPGRGSTFYFSIPANIPIPAADHHPAAG